jgi:trigger factor
VQVSVERTGPCEAKVSFTVPREVFDREYKAALKASGKNVKMKGFRPGKLPMEILEREFGAQVRQHAVEHFLGQAYNKAVEDNEFKPVGHERVDASGIDLEGSTDLEHSFEISLAPEIELGNYKGLEVANEIEPVADGELDDAISELTQQRSTPEPAGPEGIPETGMAVCSLLWVKDDETLLEREGLSLAPLVPPPGVESDAFQKALTGAHDGDEIELEMTVPDDFETEELRGQPATCKIQVTEAFALCAPADEELWALLETENEEDFREKVRLRIGEAKQSAENARQETVLLEGLLAVHEFDTPARMVEQQLQARRQNMARELAQSGVPEADIEAKLKEQADDLQADNEKAVKALFLINRIAEEEKLTVEQEELMAEVQAIATRHQAKVDDVIEYYKKNNLFQQIQMELLERKIRVFLRENAKIVEV